MPALSTSRLTIHNMKRVTLHTLLALFALVAASSALLHAQTTPWTTETPDELVSPGDFDGDGLLDVLIVDKPLGVVRLGWGRADGGLDWSDVRALALENAGSLAVGRLQSIARDSFVVTGPDWNATYLYPGTRDAAWAAQVMTPPVFAPSALAAVDVAGAKNNPNLADLFVAGGDFDPATGEVMSASVRPADLIFVGQSVLNAPQRHGHAARLTPGGQAATFAAVSATESVLTFWTGLDTAPAPGLPLVTGLPPDADFVQTALGIGQTTLFVFTRGQSMLLRQPLATATTLGAQTLHELGQPIDFVVMLQTPTLQARLLVVFDNGASAAAYSIDTAGVPLLLETFTPAAGTRFTAAASASSGGALQLLTGPASGGGTTGWQKWNFTDTAFSRGPSGAVPAVSPLAARRNVFFFSREIFVEPTATLLASAKAADWSTSVSAGSPVNASAAQFLGSAQGLGLDSPYPLGLRPALGIFGAPNQYASDISLSRLGGGGPTAPLGSLAFAPPSGTYADGTSIYLVSPRPSDAIFYRQNGTDPWVAYAGPLMLPAGGISLEAIARPVGTMQSTPIVRASYVAAAPPPLTAPPCVDADADGLCDSWEDAFGVDDPNTDPDGDLATTKVEHDAGTDPTNPADKPAGGVEFRITTVRRIGNDLRLSFSTLAGRSYAIESRPVLAVGGWAEVPGTLRSGNGTALEVTIPNAFIGPARFYRGKQLP